MTFLAARSCWNFLFSEMVIEICNWCKEEVLVWRAKSWAGFSIHFTTILFIIWLDQLSHYYSLQIWRLRLTFQRIYGKGKHFYNTDSFPLPPPPSVTLIWPIYLHIVILNFQTIKNWRYIKFTASIGESRKMFAGQGWAKPGFFGANI